MMPKILLIEDDNEIISYLSNFLNNEGFDTDSADGQAEGLRLFFENSYELVLLDISLNDGNGFSVCKKIRERSDTPIIFLTATGDEGCMVAGFEMGADDYVSKPFRPRELLARIKNAVRKSNNGKSEILSCGDIKIDTARGLATKSGREVFLSSLEYRLLLTFFSNKGRLLSRDMLMDELWAASGEYINDNTITVYIKRLREKIEDDPSRPKIIKTVRGLGYKAGEPYA